MSVRHVELAAALGVLIALVLSSKSRLHKFASTQLSEQELRDAPEPSTGRAFEPKLAVLFAAAFALMLTLAALLQRSLGANAAAFAALLAITANTVVKAGAAVAAGGRLFALRLTPSIVAMLAALWGGWWLGQSTRI